MVPKKVFEVSLCDFPVGIKPSFAALTSVHEIVGLVLWYMMLNSGIHATIAGVIVAFCVPATLKKGTGHYLERIRKNVNKFPVIDIDEQHNTIVRFC